MKYLKHLISNNIITKRINCLPCNFKNSTSYHQTFANSYKISKVNTFNISYEYKTCNIGIQVRLLDEFENINDSIKQESKVDFGIQCIQINFKTKYVQKNFKI